MKLWLLNLQLETQMLQRMNTGSLNVHFMVYSSPCYWYTKINAALNHIGLHANSLDPCLCTGHIIDLSNPDTPPSTSPLTLGLYVNDFIYFSEDPNIEQLFESLLSLLITVDFMGTVEWFLGTHFRWNKSDNGV
jgi:hypothetical protein